MADDDKLEKCLAQFLRKRRGARTLDEFARELGISKSMLHRYETAEQSISLRGLGNIMMRLGCGLGDIFPDQIVKRVNAPSRLGEPDR